MNTYSFEAALGDVVVPSPDAAARLAAKQAALAEFVQLQADRVPPAKRARDLADGSLESSTRSAKHPWYPAALLRRSASLTWLAGAVSASITGLGVVLLWSHGVRDYGALMRPMELRIIEENLPHPQAPQLAMPAPTSLTSAPPALEIATESTRGGRFEHFETNPVKRVADEPVSTFSIDVDTASYSFVRRQLNAGVLPERDAVRAEEMINYFGYSWPAPTSREQPFRATVAVSDSPWRAGNKLIHIGIKGYELPAHEEPDVNLVLLIDVGGSMAQHDRLPLVKQSIERLVPRLKPYDTVAMVVYAGAAGLVLPPTEARHQRKILDALESLQAGGSTAGAEGIRLAYELAKNNFRQGGVNRVVLATDGDFNVGITDVVELKSYVAREREMGVFLSVLGFGVDNYHDAMAQALAQNGNGVEAYIDTLKEAEKILVQESTASLFTIAKDVKLQVEFNPATVEHYRLVGYETRALEREDFENDAVDAGDIGSGHTVTAIYEIMPASATASPIDASRLPASTYAHLKIRYKQPDGNRSRLIEQPILVDSPALSPSLQRDVEFSTSVAGFAQLLRGGMYTGPLTFADVFRKAQSSSGDDPHGYRAEFVELVREAQSAKGM